MPTKESLMRKIVLLFLFVSFAPTCAHAQGAAPEMFGVGEVIVDYVHLDDPKASDTCGLSREMIASTLTKAFVGTSVPATAVVDAKPPSLGVARIDLIPEISTYADESLDCVSWVSLSAESHANLVIPPVSTTRDVTVLYWRKHNRIASGQTVHAQKIVEVLEKMAEQFAQQYRVDQPPEFAK